MTESPSKEKKELDQYEILGKLGNGAYGDVSLAKRDGKLFAMKKIEKKKLARLNRQYQAFVEKEVLRKISHPGIIKISKCFQDGKNLYYVLEYCHGGEFTNFIRLYNKQLNDHIKKFYVAEIITVLEYLHGLGLTHRDLKPENIMLSKDGHLKLIDFGTAQITKCTVLDQAFKENIAKMKKQSKKNQMPQPTQDEEQMSPRKRVATFVGTCFYLSPQLLQDNICEAPSDLWALGCIIYQLYYLEPPFKANQQYQVFEKIKNVEINYPKKQNISEEVIDLMRRLIVKTPEDRLGSNSRQGLMFEDLKKHPYFQGINFENIFTQDVPEIEEQENQKKKQDQIHQMEKINEEIQEELKKRLSKQGVILHGIVQKKSFALYTYSYFILEENFKFYQVLPYAPFNCRQAQLTPFGQAKVAEIISDNKFKIVADEAVLRVKCTKAEQWVNALNKSYETRIK